MPRLLADHKQQKIRAEFRKNRSRRARSDEWTRRTQAEGLEAHDELPRAERVSGKGDLTRKRTVLGSASGEQLAGFDVLLDVDLAAALPGTVLAVYGLTSDVQAGDGSIYRCATRRVLKTLSTDQRHVVTAGDRVLFRPEGANEGVIMRVEPRRSAIVRSIRSRQQVLLANVDQMLIVSSAAEPYLKPNLIDRLLISAHQAGVEPLVAINKIDLVDPASLVPFVGVYSQMGYRVLPVSATTGFGVDRLRAAMRNRSSAVTGQSGVGKSSLLNAVDPNLQLRVGAVSRESQKGRHTTTTARLWPLSFGGYVVDTPGIRQFQLWDVIPTEVAGYFRDLRAWIHRCRYPDCTHTHEEHCAVKDAVADCRLDLRRYESYCSLFAGEAD